MRQLPFIRVRRVGRHLIAAAVLFLPLSLTWAPASAADLESVLAQKPDAAWGRQVAREWPDVRAFYAARRHAPLWLDEEGRPTARARAAVAVLQRAQTEGLDPAHYAADALAGRLDAVEREDAGGLETAITGEVLHYLSELRHGMLAQPAETPADPDVQAPAFDAGRLLQRLTAAGDIVAEMQAMAPGNPPYNALRPALAEYRAFAEKGGWPSVPDGPTLKPGMTDPRVPALRRRLAATGDLIARDGDPEATVYDDVLESSVVRFQRRHGLKPDGIVGRNTRAALNVPAAARVQQLALNMERWRWMADDLGERYVLVNLAGFVLDVVESGSVVMDMRVVVGRPFRRTPVFTDEISYLDFSPTWTVPPTILKQDLLPELRKDPTYLATKGIEVYDGWGTDSRRLDPASIDWHGGTARLMAYRYVQPPGPMNALGRVKFMFPNRFSVYLHDTPDRGLFARASRALSSGCIRVERPADLAAYLLADQPQWTPAKIREAMAGTRTMRVNLKRTVPIHLTYATAWVGEGGTVQFREDVYGRDATLQESLADVDHWR